MNTLSDTLTITLILSLLFGSLFFYLYTRIVQTEKRVSLTENILLDLKMATENALMSFAEPSLPLTTEEVEEIPANSEEDFYKAVMEGVSTEKIQEEVETIDTKEEVTLNYESMTLKELKIIAKEKSIQLQSNINKKDIVDLLRRPVVSEVLGDSDLSDGFPIVE